MNSGPKRHTGVLGRLRGASLRWASSIRPDGSCRS